MIPMRTPMCKKPAAEIPKRAGDAQLRDDRGVSQGKKTDLGGCRDDDKGKQKLGKKGQSMTGKETAVKGGSPQIHNTAVDMILVGSPRWCRGKEKIKRGGEDGSWRKFWGQSGGQAVASLPMLPLTHAAPSMPL
jgi:hypothetical protein